MGEEGHTVREGIATVVDDSQNSVTIIIVEPLHTWEIMSDSVNWVIIFEVTINVQKRSISDGTAYFREREVPL